MHTFKLLDCIYIYLFICWYNYISTYAYVFYIAFSPLPQIYCVTLIAFLSWVSLVGPGHPLGKGKFTCVYEVLSRSSIGQFRCWNPSSVKSGWKYCDECFLVCFLLRFLLVFCFLLRFLFVLTWPFANTAVFLLVSFSGGGVGGNVLLYIKRAELKILRSERWEFYVTKSFGKYRAQKFDPQILPDCATILFIATFSGK